MFYSSHEVEMMNKYKAERLYLQNKSTNLKTNNKTIKKVRIPVERKSNFVPFKVIKLLSVFKNLIK